MLLTQLFNLQAGQIKTVAPALTIGVDKLLMTAASPAAFASFPPES